MTSKFEQHITTFNETIQDIKDSFNVLGYETKVTLTPINEAEVTLTQIGNNLNKVVFRFNLNTTPTSLSVFVNIENLLISEEFLSVANSIVASLTGYVTDLN